MVVPGDRTIGAPRPPGLPRAPVAISRSDRSSPARRTATIEMPSGLRELCDLRADQRAMIAARAAMANLLAPKSGTRSPTSGGMNEYKLSTKRCATHHARRPREGARTTIPYSTASSSGTGPPSHKAFPGPAWRLMGGITFPTRGGRANIGTLTLDGKQPALSVFRQLIEEPILVAPLCDLPQLFIAV